MTGLEEGGDCCISHRSKAKCQGAESVRGGDSYNLEKMAIRVDFETVHLYKD